MADQPEALLRDRIIHALSNYGNLNPQLTHGGYEFGIDITFETLDPFSGKQLNGIQVKCGNINAALAQSVLGQLSVAFGHKFSLVPENRLLDTAYVITDGIILPSAIEYINSANVGFRNVRWLTGDHLKPFLERYGKDFKYEP